MLLCNTRIYDHKRLSEGLVSPGSFFLQSLTVVWVKQTGAMEPLRSVWMTSSSVNLPHSGERQRLRTSCWMVMTKPRSGVRSAAVTRWEIVTDVFPDTLMFFQLLGSERKSAAFWTLEFYQAFFNVDTYQVGAQKRRKGNVLSVSLLEMESICLGSLSAHQLNISSASLSEWTLRCCSQEPPS